MNCNERLSRVLEALKHDTIEVVDMSTAYLREEGCKKLCRAVVESKNCRSLHMMQCGLTDRSREEVANLVLYSNTLRLLDMRHNRIGNETGIALLEALKSNSSIQEVRLFGCKIRADILCAIENETRRNQHIEIATPSPCSEYIFDECGVLSPCISPASDPCDAIGNEFFELPESSVGQNRSEDDFYTLWNRDESENSGVRDSVELSTSKRDHDVCLDLVPRNDKYLIYSSASPRYSTQTSQLFIHCSPTLAEQPNKVILSREISSSIRNRSDRNQKNKTKSIANDYVSWKDTSIDNIDLQIIDLPIFEDEEKKLLRTLNTRWISMTIKGIEYKIHSKYIFQMEDSISTSKPTIFFSHGFGRCNTWCSWVKLLRPLFFHGFNCVFIEWPGFGKSSGRSLQTRAWKNNGPRIFRAILDAYGTSRAVCCMHCGGAATFLRTFCEFPERFDRFQYIHQSVISEWPPNLEMKLQTNNCHIFATWLFDADHMKESVAYKNLNKLRKNRFPFIDFQDIDESIMDRAYYPVRGGGRCGADCVRVFLPSKLFTDSVCKWLYRNVVDFREE